MKNSNNDFAHKEIEKMVCSRCGIEIGKIIIINDSDEVINLGGLLLKEVHGVCCNCGQGFHYSISEKKLNQILIYLQKKEDKL